MPEESFLNKFVQRFKNFYYFFEDKWYDLLDKIDSKIPVYKIVDKVDSIIPSFILFLLIIIFFIILISYLIQFTSPFELTFTTFDSSNNALLSGVSITGFLNDQEINTQTNNKGKAVSEVNSSGKNMYVLFAEMLFGSREDFIGHVTARKEGYRNEQTELESGVLEKEILLQPIPVNPTPEPDPTFAKVRLIDSDTRDPIKDNAAYVKFDCGNRSAGIKTVRDDADGARDGIFYLSENDCSFVVREAYATGYLKDSSSKNVSAETMIDIELEKSQVKEKGDARIFVSEKGSNGEKELQGITINFSGNGVNESATTVTNGIATKKLEEGKYVITINDSNYYPITVDNNITINIVSGQLSELSIELELIPEDLRRMIYVKIVDNNGVVSGATINFYRTRTDGNTQSTINENGTLIPPITGITNITDSNGLLQAKAFNDTDIGKIIGIIKKNGYNTKLFVPTIVDYNSNYEIIQIHKTTPSNSGNALVKITVGENNALISGIKNNLYQKIILQGKEFIGFIDSKDTNSTGMSYYTALTSGDFFVSATYKNINLLSETKNILEGQTKDFNIHFNTNVTRIGIALKDFETQTIIPNQNQAIVKLFEVNEDETLNFIENISFSENKFISSFINMEKKFYITIDLNNYSPNNLLIESGSLSIGINYFIVDLTKELIVNPEDNCPNCDYSAGYECILNEDEDWTCQEIYNPDGECDVDADCENGEICVMNDNGVKVCVEIPGNCLSDIYAFNETEDDLICVDNCNDGTLINQNGFSICYDFNLPVCETHTFRFDENDNLICITPEECIAPCTLQNIGSIGNQNIFFCICDNNPLCPDGKYVWNNLGELVCSNDCDGEWARLDNIFICYPINFPHSPDGAVSIYYNNIYANTSNLISNINPVNYLHDGNNYWTSFRAVLNTETVSYKKLLTMTKVAQAKINNLINLDLPEINQRAGTYSCTLNNLDDTNIRDANNYYLPVSNDCLGNDKIRTGFEWAKNFLPKQTYYFYNKQQIQKSVDNNNFIINFRALQDNNKNISETNLNNIILPIDKYFGENVFATLKIENNPEIGINFAEPTNTANVDYNKERKVEITLFNGTVDEITNAKLSFFSYTTNARNDFKNNDVEPNGNLNIDGNKSKIISNNFSITANSNKKFETNLKSTQLFSNNQLVIVLEYFDSNNTRRRLVDVVLIETKGNTVDLDSEFLAFVNNQQYTGRIYSGSKEPLISSVAIQVDRNCDNLIENDIIFNSSTPSEDYFITENRFGTIIEGTYYLGDCLHVTVTPMQTEEYYVPITKTIYAGYNNASDPSISCVDIIKKQEGERRDASLNWNDKIILEVQNNCTSDILFRINTGLECELSNTTNPCNWNQGFLLEVEGKRDIEITGKNIDFNPEAFPNFTDRLGHYPVYVQAKFSVSRSSFVNADEFSIDLSNNEQCFEISSSWFNLEETPTANLTITNYCQDPLDDYFYPKTTLDSTGYSLTTPNQTLDNTPVSFEAKMKVGGITYETITQTTNEEMIWGISSISGDDLDALKGNCQDAAFGATFCEYNNKTFDFRASQLNDSIGNNWSTNKVQITINDVGTPNGFTPPKEIGAIINSDIKINYLDGTNKILTLSELNCNSKLATTTTNFGCATCSGAGNHCIDGIEPEYVGGENQKSYYTTFYIMNGHIGANKKVESMELSFKGNQNTDNLFISLKPIITYEKTTTIIDRSVSSAQTTDITLGNYVIPAQPNINFIINDLNRIITNELMAFDNAKAEIETNNNKVVAWINGNYLMAKYIGQENNNDKDGTIDLQLSSNPGLPSMGTQFGIINIKDYVNILKGKGLNPIRQISGVR